MATKTVVGQDLKVARAAYLLCTSGLRNGGGSDLVARTLAGLKIRDKADFIEVDEVVAALRQVDRKSALAWADAYLAGLVANKTNERRGRAYRAFVEADGFARLADALEKIGPRQMIWGESIKNPKTGTIFKFTVDVQRELNDMFGLKITKSRQAKWGTITK